MYRKLICISLLLLTTQWGMAQVQSGTVTYKIETLFEVYKDYFSQANTSGELSPFDKRFFEEIDKALPYLTYHLNFNRKEAIFKSTSYLSNDNGINIRNASQFSASDGVFYTSIQQDLKLHQFNYLGRDWLVERNKNKLKWHITDDTKMIQGYLCKKATATFQALSLPEGKITAWFAPEIPFSFGPTYYTGLPGLVLEVEQFFFRIYATDINFSKHEKKVKAPTKGKRLSVDAFTKERHAIADRLKAAQRR